MKRLSLSAALFLMLAAPTRAAAAEQLEPRAAFASGYALFAAGNLAEAKAFFDQATAPNFPLADHSLHYLGAIAFEEKDWEGARKFLSRLRQLFPQSIWFHDAELRRGKIALQEQNYPQAIAIFRALRAVGGARSELAEESLVLEAQAREALGESARAYALYAELRARFPQSPWTAAARREQAGLREKYPERFGFQTAQAWSDEADRLARERAFAEAERVYKDLLGNAAEADFRLLLLTKLAGLYLDQRKRSDALPLLETIARDYPETSQAARALYQIGQIFWNRHQNAQALEYFKRVMEEYPTSEFVDRARYAAADIYEFFGDRDRAAQLYSDLPKRYPRSPVRDDAAWRLGWLFYRAGELKQAFAAFAALLEGANNSAFRAAGRYWQARAAEKLEDRETARELYRRIADADEESYYQALALRGLERLGVATQKVKPQNSVANASPDPPMISEVAFHLTRARELAAVSLHSLAVAELDAARRRSSKQNRLRALLMREYFNNQAYARSLVLANQLPASDGERNPYRFPLAYWDLIQSNASELGIDPYLILALIRQESLFDSRARSPAFALGLMQLLPPTATRVARHLGLESPSNEKLYEPQINVTLGTRYLRELLDRYANNWHKAIAAYNAGEAAVDRWEKEIITDDMEEFVESIPYAETRGYVKLVMRNHRMYRRLYDTRQ